MEGSELSEARDLDLEVIGLAAPEVCILLTGNCVAAAALARRIHGLARGRPGPA